MRLVVMALRNLSRNARRTLLTLLTIGAGTCALLLTLGYVRHSFEGLEDALVHGGLGHFAIMPAGEDEAGTASRPPALSDWAGLAARAEGLPSVRAVAPTLRLSGIVTAGERSAGFVADALDPVRQRAMGFEPRLIEGRWLSDEAPADGAEEVVLGEALARTLGAAEGDVVTLVGFTGDGMINALDVTVVGTMTTGVSELDARLVRIHLATGARLVQSDAISSLTITLQEGASEDTARHDLEALLPAAPPALQISGWRERAPFFGQVRSLYAGIFAFLGGIVALVTWLAATNTMLMSVLERTRELGTLRAIGTSRPQVAVLLVAEATWLGLAGAALGAAAAILSAALIESAHVQLPPPPGASSPMLLELTLLPGDVTLACAGMIAAVLLASVAPLWHVLRLRIVDALGHP